MSIAEKLKSFNLPQDTVATLTYSEGTDVLHYNETEIETAIQETSVIAEFAALVVNSKIKARNRWCGEVLEHLRSGDFLEDYERGSFDFENYLAETIADNFYDVELIDHSTEKYDHKRGFTTLSVELEVDVADLIEHDPCLPGWTISVPMYGSTISFTP